ncbi:hypothetical protein [Dethiosulfatarculus sandiegensis]|nr:hypothetical protein [Dethiosulfatarculus sandiegensis]
MQLDIPGPLGSCHALSTSRYGGIIIYLPVGTLPNVRFSQKMIDVISWIVDRYGISNIAIDGFTSGFEVNGFTFRNSYGEMIRFDKEDYHSYLTDIQRYLLTGKYRGFIHGIDSLNEYQSQLNAFMSLYPLKRKIVLALRESLFLAIERAESIIPNKFRDWFYSLLPLTDLEECNDYTNTEIYMEAVFELLKETIKHNIDLGIFPSLNRIKELSQRKTDNLSLKNESVMRELKSLLQNLQHMIYPHDFEKIETSFHKIQCNQINQNDAKAGLNDEQLFILNLKYILVTSGISIDNYENLCKLIDIVELENQINEDISKRFQREVQELFKLYVQNQCKQDFVLRYLEIIDMIYRCYKLISIKIVPAEYREFISSRMDAFNIIKSLRQIHVPLIVEEEELDAAIEFAKDFYFHANSRARNMANQVQQLIKQQNKKSVDTLLVVTTGFLEPSLTNTLNLSETACYVVHPVVPEDNYDIDEFYKIMYERNLQYGAKSNLMG